MSDSISGMNLMRAHGALLADEVFRAVRHGVLNRLTGLGAVGFQLRERLGRQAQVRGDAGGEDTATAELFASLSRQIGLASEAVTRNLFPARVRSPHPCDIPRTVKDVLALVGPSRVSFADGAAPRVFAAVDPLDVAVAVFCLVENALEAIDETVPGQVQADVQSDVQADVSIRCAARDKETVAIEVVGGGSGLTPATAEHVFDRFFTTKSGHLGLGLNVAAGVASRWGGAVELTNRADGHAGAVARLVLPGWHQA